MTRTCLWSSLLGAAVLCGCAGTEPTSRDDVPLRDATGPEPDDISEWEFDPELTHEGRIDMLTDLRDAMYPPVSDAELFERAVLECWEPAP